ncbi:uncharacterized protein LOC129654294 [Bubalus kerabau]|uniref:uncharacterized protein LOC129654294 n=1 Tax=Bubalus carabanensis TaxID=3119969 RepID=UPI00244ED111|nr:uncharacterized protein LOC129654294 [Bubalus carabanensis]
MTKHKRMENRSLVARECGEPGVGSLGDTSSESVVAATQLCPGKVVNPSKGGAEPAGRKNRIRDARGLQGLPWEISHALGLKQSSHAFARPHALNSGLYDSGSGRHRKRRAGSPAVGLGPVPSRSLSSSSSSRNGAKVTAKPRAPSSRKCVRLGSGPVPGGAVAGVEVRPPGHLRRRPGQGVASPWAGSFPPRPHDPDPTTPTLRPRAEGRAEETRTHRSLPREPAGPSPRQATPARPGAPPPLAVTSWPLEPRPPPAPWPPPTPRPPGPPSSNAAAPPMRRRALRPAQAHPAPYACAALSSRPSHMGRWL